MRSWVRTVTFAVAAVVVCGCAERRQVVTDGVKVSERWDWNAEDTTEILQRALDSGERKIVIDRQASDWITRPLFITNSNIEVVLEDGVSLRAKRCEFYGKSDCLIRITGGAKNVVLRGEGKATLAMNKKDYLDPKQNYAFSEWRHAVSILSAENVTVKDLTILSSGGDGVYVNGPKGVTLESLAIRDHNRQGMSPISVTGMTVRRCSFNETRGAPPQCGIDMEPNRETNHFIDVVYEDCEFDGNAASGIDMYFGNFSARTKPVSITYRRCVSRGNGHHGMTFMTGAPKLLLERGHVGGFVRFEDCTFEGNGAQAGRIVNHMVKGLDISFARCTFDARGSRAEAAISLYNGQLTADFGGLRFEDCTVRIDRGRKAFAFEAPPGIGIAGKLEGSLTVDEAGVRKPFDFAAFMARHVPHPELVTHFKSAEIDYSRLAAPPAAKMKGRFTPALRKPFVFVQAVPAAGEYAIRFKSRKVRTDGREKLCAVVNLLDRAGTDLGCFEVPEGDFTYMLKAHGANVYRFEVSQRNTATVQVSSTTPGAAIQAGRSIHLFRGRNEDFYFRVPANAKEVLVNLMPAEPGCAQLLDASGKVVDEMPFGTAGKVLKGVKEWAVTDEVWHLRFPKIEEDFCFQIGGDAVPLISTEREGVIGARVPAAAGADGAVRRQERVEGARRLRVLSIGNSFSASAMAELPKAAAAYPGCQLDFVNMMIGGCTLKRHWDNVEAAEKNPSYRPYGISASYAFDKKEMPRKANIQEMLVADRWDIVTIQQGSSQSAFPESYQPFADKLIAKIRELAPQAEIRIQQTWSYSPYDGRLREWKMSPDSMYAALKDAYDRLAARHSLKIIPTGDAVALYRAKLPVRYDRILTGKEIAAIVRPGAVDFHGDPVGSSAWKKERKDAKNADKTMLRLDPSHLNAEGKYLQACVWLAALFDVDVTRLDYEPSFKGFAPRAKLMRECAAEAVAGSRIR